MLSVTVILLNRLSHDRPVSMPEFSFASVGCLKPGKDRTSELLPWQALWSAYGSSSFSLAAPPFEGPLAPNAALKTFLKASVLKPLNVLLLILLLLQAVESAYSATFGYKFHVGFTVEF